MDALDKLLGVDPEHTISALEDQPQDLVPAPTTSTLPTTTLPTAEKELEDDFQFARKGTREMISATRSALESAILLAQAGDSPRAFEVVGKMLESIVNANRELVEFHRTKKDTLQPSEQAQSLLPQGGDRSVNIERAVFVGRASDLLRELKEIEKQQKIKDAEIIEASSDAHTTDDPDTPSSEDEVDTSPSDD